MKLYNTLSRKSEELRPLNPPHVTMYTCGPTVYDYLQIGNWLAFIRWDMLARTLKLTGFDPQWIMNITDVGHLVSDADEGEDKLEKGAKREGKTAWEVAEFYTKDFLDGLDALNISVPRNHLPKATDHIQEQIDLILELEKNGHTYRIDDGIYFDTAKLPDYGKLGRLKLEELKAGARVEYNTQKRSLSDFALWKFSPKGPKRDMEWDSPWGKGFPGWHLECSAMAMKYLGKTIDIHAGGVDHIPVHHTNEIAQSEAATGKPFAQIWLHSNFLTVDGVKLSKSLGNSYSLQDLKGKGFEALDFRVFALQSHYHNETNFTWEGLDSARNRRKNMQAMADLRFQPHDQGIDCRELLKAARNDITASLQKDLHTPGALARLSELGSRLETGTISTACLKDFIPFIKWLDEVFGLNLEGSHDLTKQQKSLLTERDTARQKKDWNTADRNRTTLEEQGIDVRDTGHGQIWSRL